MNLEELKEKAEWYQEHERDFERIAGSAMGRISIEYLVNHLEMAERYVKITPELKARLAKFKEYMAYRAKLSRNTKFLRRLCLVCGGWVGYYNSHYPTLCPICSYAIKLKTRKKPSVEQADFLRGYQEKLTKNKQAKKHWKKLSAKQYREKHRQKLMEHNLAQKKIRAELFEKRRATKRKEKELADSKKLVADTVEAKKVIAHLESGKSFRETSILVGYNGDRVRRLLSASVKIGLLSEPELLGLVVKVKKRSGK